VRRLVVGLDTAGRSCLVEEAPLNLKVARSGGHQLARVYETDSAPPPAPLAGHANFVDVGLGSGILRWIIIQFEPNIEFPMHQTDTIDCVLVLDGSVELELDDGLHLLETRDCVIIPAIDHGWKAGPSGCQLCVMAIGTPPHVLG
jgi:quercetin dioxygenase-like cupin family protein